MKMVLQAAFLLLLVANCICVDCDENMKRANCLDCNEDNYCIKCAKGFYLEKAIGSESGGHCIKCQDRCLECQSKDTCKECSPGYIPFPDKCIACEMGCTACEGTPKNCTACAQHYKLDIAGECYFRYSVLALLGGIVGLYLMMFGFCQCMNSIRKSSMASPAKREQSESILGDEFRSTPTMISDVTQIGKSEEKDLSLVIEAHENSPSPRPSDESMRQEIFDEKDISENKGTTPAKLKHFAKTKK